jgi:hypothetical protein
MGRKVLLTIHTAPGKNCLVRIHGADPAFRCVSTPPHECELNFATKDAQRQQFRRVTALLNALRAFAIRDANRFSKSISDSSQTCF